MYLPEAKEESATVEALRCNRVSGTWIVRTHRFDYILPGYSKR